MSDQNIPEPDPGNSDPSKWMEDLNKPEQREIRERLIAEAEPVDTDPLDRPGDE